MDQACTQASLQPRMAAEHWELPVLWQETRRQKLLFPPDKLTSTFAMGLSGGKAETFQQAEQC